MNCIDAIEGTVKSILTRICIASGENATDMSDYIQSIKSVLEATRTYVISNPEITPDPEVLISVLYNHARDTWIATFGNDGAATESQPDHHEYLAYCFDHIFTHGAYPL